ncbi:MAG TPA: succinate dehydrogenase [Casimicrobiaceae bacterium]|nr:succinate dehydrogenase [Casimicrobiaceae bacterium]
MTRTSVDRLGVRLWVAQRASAAVLALCVVVHLATILHAARGGLTAAEILERTRGSVVFFAFYALFALAIAVHVPIGLRNVAIEWLHWRGRSLDAAMLLLAMLLFVFAMRAVWGVFR